MKKISVLLALVTVWSLLVGSTAVLAQDEKVPLSIWVFEGEEEFLFNVESTFEAAHPNIDLNITLIPEEEYVTKIETALAAGEPPDIGFVYEARWMKIGAVVPLDDLVAELGIDMNNLNQSALVGCYSRKSALLSGVELRTGISAVQQRLPGHGRDPLSRRRQALDHRRILRPRCPALQAERRSQQACVGRRVDSSILVDRLSQHVQRRWARSYRLCR